MSAGRGLLNLLRNGKRAVIQALGQAAHAVSRAVSSMHTRLTGVVTGIARRHSERLADDPQYRTQLGTALVAVVATAVPHPVVAAAIAALASVWLLGDQDSDDDDGWDDDPHRRSHPSGTRWSPRPDNIPQSLWDRYND